MKFYIKEARERAGYTQKELAAIIGVAPNTFHGYESGKHDPKSDLLAKIAKACDVSVDFLLGISEVYPTKKGSSARNVIQIAGRDGSFTEKNLTDDQVKALRAIVDQLPDIDDKL